MIEITFNDDETINVDYWGPRVEIARKLRPDAWFEIVAEWRASGGVLDFDATPVQELFLGLRIDGQRARRMLDARGDIAAAPIDPAPSMAEDGENQLLSVELFNETVVLQALADRRGIMSVNFGRQADVERFVDMRQELARENLLKPGLRGI